MAERYPLVVDSSNYRVEEIPSGDDLNVNGGGVVNANFYETAGGSSGNNTTIGPNADAVYNLGSRIIQIGSNATAIASTATEAILIGQGAGQCYATGSRNVFIGCDAGYNHVNGSSNIGIGHSALAGGSAGLNGANENISIGSRTGASLTSGCFNIFMGFEAGTRNATGSHNVHLGTNAGSNSTASNNVFLGFCAGYNNTSSSNNILIGANAGVGITENNSNHTFIGDQAGYSVTGVGATSSVMIGRSAGQYATSGGRSVYIGYGAGQYTGIATGSVYLGFGAGCFMTGDNNVAIGQSALVGKSGVSTNRCTVAIGYQVGTAMTTGFENIFLGFCAAGGRDYSVGNIAIGREALYGVPTNGECTSGGLNIALGRCAGYGVTGGFSNIYLGSDAGKLKGFGGHNVAIGCGALCANGAGSCNQAVGCDTLRAVTSGCYNAAFGNQAGSEVTSGCNNVLLGHQSGKTGSPSGEITTGSNIICLGDNSITDIFCADTTISSSDQRDKADIVDFTAGLDVVAQLRPVTYKWDKRSWYVDDLNFVDENGEKREPTAEEYKAIVPDGTYKKERVNVGLLAQEVQALEQTLGYSNSVLDELFVSTNEDGTSMGVKYERLVVLLINAIKELKTRVEALEG